MTRQSIGQTLDPTLFQTEQGQAIPAVSADEMREVDRIAVEEFNLGILQMMENAGRNLAQLAMLQLKGDNRTISILAGSGGNGGGGLCCARHLFNRDYEVQIFLSKPRSSLRGAVKVQLEILESAGVKIASNAGLDGKLEKSALILDALIGYSLNSAPTGAAAELIHLANHSSIPIISLDLPSGMDATSGESPGISVNSESTLTLALPKTGLRKYRGSVYLGDIGIPPQLYRRLGFEPPAFARGKFILPLRRF
jgi:NAD(P)H-hydrate epimerase